MKLLGAGSLGKSMEREMTEELKKSSGQHPEENNANQAMNELITLLNEVNLQKLDKRLTEEYYESAIYSSLTSKTNKYKQQHENKSDIRVNVLGANHKPDGIYDSCVALEIKKISGIGGVTHAIQRVLGQAICYKAKYSGVVLLLLDFTGRLWRAWSSPDIENEESNNLRIILEQLNIKVVIKASK